MTGAAKEDIPETETPAFVRVDLSENPNIHELSRMLRDASSMSDPARMVRHFGPWISKRVPRDGFLSVSRRGLPEGSYKFTRVFLDRGGRTDPETGVQDPWSNWGNIQTHRGGIVWDIMQNHEPQLYNRVDFTRDPVLSGVLGPMAGVLKSVAAIPTFDSGEALNWAFVFQRDPEWRDLEIFESGFLDLNMLGTATRNLVSRRTVEDLNGKLEDQFNQVGRIQRALIPESNPDLEGYALATSYKPSTQAGGDYYEYFQFPDGRLGLIIADVSGHGAGAATVMAMIAASLRAFSIQHENDDIAADPAEVARFINKILVTSALPGMFVTAFLCVLDPRTGTIDWVRCGHNPPRIRGADGSVRELGPPGTLPLGIDADLTVPSSTSMLEPGETLVLYTDGITEAKRAGSRAELFGEERLDEALRTCSGEPGCAIQTINEALNAFTGSADRTDDQTIVVVRHNADHTPQRSSPL